MEKNLTHLYGRHAFVLLLCIFVSISVLAVPAWNGWQTKTMPDGSTIVVRLIGDEFYHFWETQDGKLAVEQTDGTFVVKDEPLPTPEKVSARRKASPMYKDRPRKIIGVTNQAPRGLVILVQYGDDAEDEAKNVKFQEANNKQGFLDLLNKENYDYDGATGSARDYFIAQSNGKYSPEFDVFGPVTLSHNAEYYGEEGEVDIIYDGKNYGKKLEHDMYMADFVIEATTLADGLGCNFSQYDSDNDGCVDIVYFFFAGKGQAAGGESWTIWPHNWYLSSAVSQRRTHDTETYPDNYEHIIDGVKIDNYACSAELKYNGHRSGVGTFSHEFSHVLGLPDYYDTSSNQYNRLCFYTPNVWSIMDYGSYNNDERTPPSYSIFDKYFMGWAEPKVLAQNANLNVEISSDYGDGYQIVRGLEKVPWDYSLDTVYYVENRQQTGWDAPLPGHGMLVWRVVYDQLTWAGNDVNATPKEPRYTIVPGSGGMEVGEGYTHKGDQDPFPGASGTTTYTAFDGSVLNDINEQDGSIYFRFNDGGSCHPVNVSLYGTGVTYSLSATCAVDNLPLIVTFTPENAGYNITYSSIRIGWTSLVEGTDYEFTDDNRKLTIFASALTAHSGEVSITVMWSQTRYTYHFSLVHNCEVPADGVVDKNQPLDLLVIPDEGYALNGSSCWTIRIGSTFLTYGSDYTYDPVTHILHINSVNGNLTISPSAYPAVSWYAQGDLYTVNPVVGSTITLPDAPSSCPNGKSFVGWYTDPNYDSSTAPTFAKYGDECPSPAEFYAVYGRKDNVEIKASVTANKSSSTDLPTEYGDKVAIYIGSMYVQLQQVAYDSDNGVIKWRGAEESQGAGYMYSEYKNYSHPVIHSIVITYNPADTYRNISLKIGSSRNPTEGKTVTPYVKGNVYTFNCMRGNLGEHFLLTNGEHEALVDKIVVNYTDNPTFISYSTACDLPSYTVTFLNDDDSPIGEPQQVYEGDAAIPPVLERECNMLSWDKDYTYVTEDMTVKAVWTPDVEFAVMVTSEDENKGTVAYTKLPTCTDLTISIRATANDGYDFAGWSDGVEEAERTVTLTQDTTIVAQFVKKVKITWWNYDYSELAVTYVSIGVTPVYPYDTPTREGTASIVYTFSFWSPTIIPATEDATYVAIYQASLRKYTVTFLDENGMEMATYETFYEGHVTAPSVTARECYDYSWDKDFSYVTENMIVNLVWTPKPAPYTWSVISSDDSKGTVSVTKEPTACDLTITFQADPKEGYKFLKWSDEDTNSERSFELTQDINLVADWVEDSTTDIDDVDVVSPARKIVHDEQILILRDGKTYTVTGQQIK